ncbi:MAG: hypothetical protein K6G65_02760 [Lachnospiraceae bacterium]|nr:hypothetical protein [Lachnospiraceae bacterium]
MSFKKWMRGGLCVLIGCLMLGAGVSNHALAAKVKSISKSSLEKTEIFYFSKLPTASVTKLRMHTVQNFSYTPDMRFMFVTQEASAMSNDNIRHCCLSLCTPDETQNACKRVDYHILKNYGHSESLSVTQPDLNKMVYHIWLTSGSTKKNKFGNKITRLTYEVKYNKEGVPYGTIRHRVTLKDFKYTKVVKSKGKKKAAALVKIKGVKTILNRVGVTCDQENNQICFRSNYEEGQGIYYAVYRLDKVNAYLNHLVKKKKTSGSIKKLASAQLANIYCMKRPVGYYKSDGSAFQSYEIRNNVLYISGGILDYGKYSGGIYAIPYGIGRNSIQWITSNSQIKKYYQIQTKKEIEGLHISEIEGNMYATFNFFNGPNASSSTLYAYRLKVN